MIPQRSPLILAGQIYLSEDLDEYLIVTRNNRGQIYYEGDGFKGQSEDWTFIEKFKPVDPDDVDNDEITCLIEKCPCGTKAMVGYIAPSNEDEYYEDEETEMETSDEVIMA